MELNHKKSKIDELNNYRKITDNYRISESPDLESETSNTMFSHAAVKPKEFVFEKGFDKDAISSAEFEVEKDIFSYPKWVDAITEDHLNSIVSTNLSFEDELFPPNMNSLLSGNYCSCKSKFFKTLLWKRASEIYQTL